MNANKSVLATRPDGFRSSIYMLKHLEIWGIACTLPAKKIATLIYLQPFGNMKGKKETHV